MQLIREFFQNKAFRSVGVFMLSAGFMGGSVGGADIVPSAQKKVAMNEEVFKNWKKFHSVSGQCTVAFPDTPEHVKQTMSMTDDEYDMQYDVYVAASGKQAVYMVLIAQYPSFVDESYAELSLESFLNGILTQHPSNQLVFADLIDVQGHKGMDFFIKTKGVYFKGRAIMAGNQLYLLAMECEMNNYVDNHFNFFINSFEFKN